MRQILLVKTNVIAPSIFYIVQSERQCEGHLSRNIASLSCLFIPTLYLPSDFAMSISRGLRREQELLERSDSLSSDDDQTLDEVLTKSVFLAFDLHSEGDLNRFLTTSIKPKKEDGSIISFSEYVNLICFLGMIGEKDFSKFLFACADVASEFYIR